ncbi:MAG TPA: PilZ domain-containing protein [Gammaproteobacteria bacterium]|nr:PilZ domain-containing protein [Gammaproteobacteria bacterium]
MTLPSPERRSSPRIYINGEMTYRTGDSAEIHQGEIENMSAGGVLIWIRQDLTTPCQLAIRVEADDLAESALELRATLLHKLSDRKDDLYGYGCSVESITDLPD